MARSRIEIAGEALEHQTDGDLAVRAAAGDREAFEELYRRHSRTAMRVAYRVTGNIHDAGDAVSDAFARVMQALPKGRLAEPDRFRAYLMTATRHASVDVLRRAGRSVPSEEDPEPAQTNAGPSEVLIDATDSSLVAAAFRALPERWRSVLWLTEVEQIPPREAAGMLGVSANGVAQLAVRARAGLRERYLQAHLREVDGDCRQAVDRLGAYVGGALAPRDLSVVDQHLAGCGACRDREVDLREIGTTLRRGLAPIPAVGAGAGGVGRWIWRLFERGHRAAATFGNPATGAGAAKAVPVGLAAAGVFVASLAGAGMIRTRAPESAALASPVPAALGGSAPTQKGASVPTVNAAGTRTSASSSSSAATRPAATANTARTGTSAFTSPAAADRARTRSTIPALDGPADQSAAPSSDGTGTTGTTGTDQPPASQTDDQPPVSLPDLPVTVPTTIPVIDGLPEITVPTTLPEITPALIDALSSLVDLPLETAYEIQDALATVDSQALSLALAGADAPLPSPGAAGLPV